MTSEQRYFIEALSNFVNVKKSGCESETTHEAENLNKEVLSSYAKKHEVQAILYYQTKDSNYLSAYSSTLYSNTNRKNMVQKVTDIFDFPYFIVKGSSIAELYPVPELRTMGDIDMVVHTEDRERVHDILTSQGYKCTSKQDIREWQYYKNNMEFELHDHLVYSEAVNNSKQEAFFNNFWPYVKNNTINWNFHFLFLISHLRKHFMNEGVGFRQFMDIAIVSKYGKLDWSWIEEKAEQIELIDFLRTVLAFNTHWFNVITPITTPKLDNDFYESATEKIFEDGVFGFGNEHNADSKAANLYRKNGKLGMLGSAIGVLFPSYKTLITVPKYSWLKGRAYLLPLAWIYRFIMGRSKSKGAVESMKKSFAGLAQIERREAMYKQWGL